MKVGIVDADLLDHGTRHPNLALMKISGYLKRYFKRSKLRHTVELIKDYSDIDSFSKIIISKVFSFSKLPASLERKMVGVKPATKLEQYTRISPKIVYGGTGFNYCKDVVAPKLPESIERCMPDYSLYDEYVNQEIKNGANARRFNDYKFYSIGFLTRGCFRKCAFCVNRHYDHVVTWSRLSEFLDKRRPYIYLWDDNFLGLGLSTRMQDRKAGIKEPWEKLLDELDASGKPFQFRQGLDMRLMDEKIAERLSRARYHGDFIFAFDHYEQHKLIEKNLKIWRKYNKRTSKFYVLCAYEGIDENDIEMVFKRIKILMKYGCLPYIMRYENYKKSIYKGIYIQLARWCNQPQFFKKKSFREFCLANQDYHKGTGECSAVKAMNDFIKQGKNNKRIAEEYFDLRYDKLNNYQCKQKGGYNNGRAGI